MTARVPSIPGVNGEIVTVVPVVLVDETGNYVPAIPLSLITGIGEGDGSSRIRVDAAQSSFFDKREFYFEEEFNIPAGQRLLYQFISSSDFIVEIIDLVVDGGSVRLTTYGGGTPAGAFSARTPLPANTMAEGPPVNPSNVSLNRAGPGASPGVGLTGGTQKSVTRVVASNATAQAQSVGDTQDGYRGNPAGTYYALLDNFGSGAATGVFRLRWEQRA